MLHPGGIGESHSSKGSSLICPILSEIQRPEISSLTLVEIKKYMLLDPSPHAGGKVVMSLDNGAPLLSSERAE